LDPQARRHLLVPVPSSIAIAEDRRSSGVHITRRELVDAGGARHFVDVHCLKPHLDAIFSVLIAEMLDALATEPGRPDVTCRRILDHWRELLEREPLTRPGLETLIGLYGELWHLRELTRFRPDAIAIWAGP